MVIRFIEKNLKEEIRKIKKIRTIKKKNIIRQ